jgi:hypothetical protein
VNQRHRVHKYFFLHIICFLAVSLLLPGCGDRGGEEDAVVTLEEEEELVQEPSFAETTPPTEKEETVLTQEKALSEEEAVPDDENVVVLEKSVNNPTFSPSTGNEYDTPQEVVITTSTDGAQIFYTLDNTDPSMASLRYSEPLQIRQAGTTIIKAIAVKQGYQNSAVVTATYSINYGDLPLGEIGGLHYVWWDFGIDAFQSLYINITIYEEPDSNDGLYFQMYQGRINDIGFYFGLQTDVYKPSVGSTGKGLIFSRWQTRDLSDVRTAEGGWSQSACYEGDFVGIRKHYEWTNHSYQLKLAYIESDDVGDWYGVWIYDLDSSTENFLGSIRFPVTKTSASGIANGWVTWTELYYKDIPQTPIPHWHVSIDGIYATEQKVSPLSATSAYSDITHTDINYDRTTDKIHFFMGSEVIRQHDAGKLF